MGFLSKLKTRPRKGEEKMENDIKLFNKVGGVIGKKIPNQCEYVATPYIKAQIRAHCAIEPNCTWIWGDAGYRLMTPDLVGPCMYYSHIYDRPYIPHCHDCEDFARETKSFVSGEWLAGCYALAIVFANAYDSNGQYMFSHGMNLFTCNDDQVYMTEPQHANDVWQMPGVGSWFMKHVAEFKLALVSH